MIDLPMRKTAESCLSSIDPDQLISIMNVRGELPQFKEKVMRNASSNATAFKDEGKKPGLNVNKLQAVLCMAASAAVSIGLIVWIVKAIL